MLLEGGAEAADELVERVQSSMGGCGERELGGRG
jgi:hypothetical protein